MSSFHTLEPDVTTGCGMHCHYCYTEPGERTLMAMPLDVFRVACNWLAQQAAPKVQRLRCNLFGGEALSDAVRCQHMAEIADGIAREHGKSVHYATPTNALNVCDDYWRFWRDHDTGFNISIDGTAASHNAHRVDCAGKGTADRVFPNARRILARYPNTAARMTVTPETVGSMAEGVKALTLMGFRRITPIPAYEADWSKTAQYLGPEMVQIADWYRECWQAGRPIYLHFLDRAIRAFVQRHRPRAQCGAGRNTIALAVDGSLWPCHRFTHLHREHGHRHEMCLGRVVDDAVEFRPDVANIFQAADPARDCRGPCAHCEAQSMCTGGCPYVNWAMTGDTLAPPSLYCLFIQTAWQLGIETYHALAHLPEFQRRFEPQPKAQEPPACSNP